MATAVEHNTLALPGTDAQRDGTFTRDVQKDSTYVVTDDEDVPTPRSDAIDEGEDEESAEKTNDDTKQTVSKNEGEDSKNKEEGDKAEDENAEEKTEEVVEQKAAEGISEDQDDERENRDNVDDTQSAGKNDDGDAENGEKQESEEGGPEETATVDKNTDETKEGDESVHDHDGGRRSESPKDSEEMDKKSVDNESKAGDQKNDAEDQIAGYDKDGTESVPESKEKEQEVEESTKKDNDDVMEHDEQEVKESRESGSDPSQEGHDGDEKSQSRPGSQGHGHGTPGPESRDGKDVALDGEADDQDSKQEDSAVQESQDSDKKEAVDSTDDHRQAPEIVIEKADSDDKINVKERTATPKEIEEEAADNDDRCDGQDSSRHVEFDTEQTETVEEDLKKLDLDEKVDEDVEQEQEKADTSVVSDKKVSEDQRSASRSTACSTLARSPRPESKLDRDSPLITSRSEYAIENVHHNASSILDSIHTIQRENARMKEENDRLRMDKNELQRRLRRVLKEYDDTKKELNDRIDELENELQDAVERVTEFEDLAKSHKRRGRLGRVSRRERYDSGLESPYSHREKNLTAVSLHSRPELTEGTSSRVEGYLKTDVERLEKYNTALEQTLKAEIEKRTVVQKLLEDVMTTNEAFKSQFQKWNETEENYEKLKKEHAELLVKYRQAIERRGTGASLELLPYKRNESESKLGKGDIWERIETAEVELKDSKQRVQVLEDYLKRLYNGDLQIMIKPAAQTNSDKVPFLPSIEESKSKPNTKTYAGLAARKKKFKYGNPTT